MPSSHSALAIGILVYSLTDLRAQGHALTSTRARNLFIQFVPIPVARVILHDHSIKQVAAGAGFGCVIAIFWILVLQKRLDCWITSFHAKDPGARVLVARKLALMIMFGTRLFITLISDKRTRMMLFLFFYFACGVGAFCVSYPYQIPPSSSYASIRRYFFFLVVLGTLVVATEAVTMVFADSIRAIMEW